MKNDDDLEHEGVLGLLIESGKAGLGAFAAMAAFYSVFSDGLSLERILIIWLFFWVIALTIKLYRSFSKNNFIIQKYNQQKADYDALDEKNNALAEQFREKSCHLSMILIDIPLVYNMVYSMILNQDGDVRIHCFEFFKEALRKWENRILK